MSGIKRDYTLDYQDRPARIQLEYKDTITPEVQGGTYNIWYSKWQGEGAKFGKGVDPSSHRLVVERDAGKTRATAKMPFCIHFAHGKCTRGHNCGFLHRIPIPGDKIETTIDCFGRDKFRTDREDMGGVGSFERRCQTLYVGNLIINDHMEVLLCLMKETCRAHFSEWGEIEVINILEDKGVAFIQYKSILNAEFAKEAMQGQTLESAEVVNVRWANEDPNPQGIRFIDLVKENLKRKAEEHVIETIKAQLPVIGNRGSLLDYQKGFKSIEPLKKPKVEDEIKPNQGFFGNDLDDWDLYCKEYYEKHGVYPKGYVSDENEVQKVTTASSVYAVKPVVPKSKLLVSGYESSDDD